MPEETNNSAQSSLPRQRAWFASLLLQRQNRLMPRFAAAMARLRALPRAPRRWFQRKAAVTLAGAAMVLALGAANFGPPGAQTVYAATITVDNGAVALDPGNGDCSLIEAVLNANDDGVDHSGGDCDLGAGADTITLPAAGSFIFTTYYLYANGRNGLPTITSEITISGNGSTIDLGGSAVAIRLALVEPTGDLTLENTTVSNGYMFDATYGGGIFRVNGGELTISGSTLIDSETNSYGGAINVRASGTLIVTNGSTISGNFAFRGGGIYSRDSDITIENSSVSGNYAERTGAGVQTFGGSLSISGSTINDNGWEPGQIGVVGYVDYGGGVFAHDGSLNVINSTFDGNYGGYGGGGLRLQDITGAVIMGSTISNNTAQSGGGIQWGGFRDSGAYPVTGAITNTTISGNEANYNGGGISVSTGELTLNNVTISSNTAAYYGGGIIVNGDASSVLNRTIISGNAAVVSGAEIYVYDGTYGTGTATADNFNLIGHSALTNTDAFVNFTPGASDITATSDGTQPTALAAILGALADNGGPTTPATRTHALVAGSPAIDRGPNADCTAAPVSSIDQRSEPRVIDIPGTGNNANAYLCDIGAYELQTTSVGICPIGADNQYTDILGIGMGNPKKHRNVAKLVIPNHTDVVSLYGQLAAVDDGKANYVRFIYPGKTGFEQVNAITSPAPRSAAVFWYGTDLDPSANIRGRWFLQATGAKKHIPRALVLYPTYETEPDEYYVNVFELLHPVDTQVYWDTLGWTPSRQIVVELPAPTSDVTLTVKLAMIGNDKDVRPVFVTVTAGGVSETQKPSVANRGDQLNIMEFTLVDVPAGTDKIVVDIVSPDPFTNELGALGGDSAALVGLTANYECQP